LGVLSVLSFILDVIKDWPAIVKVVLSLWPQCRKKNKATVRQIRDVPLPWEVTFPADPGCVTGTFFTPSFHMGLSFQHRCVFSVQLVGSNQRDMLESGTVTFTVQQATNDSDDWIAVEGLRWRTALCTTGISSRIPFRDTQLRVNSGYCRLRGKVVIKGGAGRVSVNCWFDPPRKKLIPDPLPSPYLQGG